MKKKPRVYLSKSRAGSDFFYNNIRSYLNKFDLELLECSKWDHGTLLKSADLVLIIPPFIEECTVFVGKGQYTELKIADEEQIETRFVEEDCGHFFFSGYSSVEVIANNWHDEYACAELGTQHGFKKILPNIEEVKNQKLPKEKPIPTGNVIKSKPMLACINLIKK